MFGYMKFRSCEKKKHAHAKKTREVYQKDVILYVMPEVRGLLFKYPSPMLGGVGEGKGTRHRKKKYNAHVNIGHGLGIAIHVVQM